MPDFNAVPWTTADLIDFAFLVVATIMVTSFPLVYGLRARLRDPLAISVIIATSLTALAFILSVAFTLMLHAGVVLPELTAHWLSRLLVLGVGIGKVQLLWMLLRTTSHLDRRHDEPVAARE